MKTALLCLAACLALPWSAVAACLGDPTAPRPVSVHVVPQLPPALLFARWSPLLEQVGRKTGQCFELTIASSIPEFERALLKGTPDVAFVNPYHAVMVRRRQGYIPLLMDSQERLSGILAVTSDSPIQTVAALDGKTVVFPAPNAFAASLLIRAHLAGLGIRIEPRYVQTHASVYRAVALGEVIAGGGVNNTLQREEPALRTRLRVLYETPSYAPHPLVAHPRLSAAQRESVTSAFMGMASTDTGRQLLDQVQLPVPVRANYDRDYAPLERLGLGRFVVLDER
jgi:phosphonate transport system substrate-binding protein